MTMKKIVLFFGLIISSSLLFAQGSDEASPLTRKEKRNAEIGKQYQLTQDMLENKNFVLESDFLQDRYGNRIHVSSNINFVAVDSTEAIIQIGSNWGIGPNGLGGVTARGEITKWELVKNEKSKSFSLRMNVMTPIGIYDLYVSVSASGSATATLTSLRAGQLMFDGNIVQGANSSYFVGQSL